MRTESEEQIYAHLLKLRFLYRDLHFDQEQMGTLYRQLWMVTQQEITILEKQAPYTPDTPT